MNQKTIFLLALVTLLALQINAQTSVQKSQESQNLYNECLAIVHKGEMLVDEYSPRGKCVIQRSMTGLLTVPAIQLLSKNTIKEREKTSFMVGIKNKHTNTLWMYTTSPVKEIAIENVLGKCQRDDQIVFMTVDQKYSLAHHTIDVVWD